MTSRDVADRYYAWLESELMKAHRAGRDLIVVGTPTFDQKTQSWAYHVFMAEPDEPFRLGTPYTRYHTGRPY